MPSCSWIYSSICTQDSIAGLLVSVIYKPPHSSTFFYWLSPFLLHLNSLKYITALKKNWHCDTLWYIYIIWALAKVTSGLTITKPKGHFLAFSPLNSQKHSTLSTLLETLFSLESLDPILSCFFFHPSSCSFSDYLGAPLSLTASYVFLRALIGRRLLPLFSLSNIVYSRGFGYHLHADGTHIVSPAWPFLLSSKSVFPVPLSAHPLKLQT